ncbi:peptidoglycan-binding protein [Phaeobacter sp. SYSU ZJ3003]|uniref:peptidoglycan-binding protein n=1 Tax=Phaeobacter sp. SYSU ZJ3003 TaxID=2109330 RepID=UPI00351C7B69
MAVALKAPVGEKKRISKGAPVKNDPEDVRLVQMMLIANGFSATVTGNCSSTLIKSIKTFQSSKCGNKRPDGIVDPGGTTWKAGLPKLRAKIAADEKHTDNVVLVKEGGKQKYVIKSEFYRNQEALKKKVIQKADRISSEAEVWIDFSNRCSEIAAGADGFVSSFTSFIVASVTGGKSEPPYGPLLDARAQATFLKALASHKQPDWEKVLKQDKIATKAHKKGQDAFSKFIETRIGAAGAINNKLETISEINFAVVQTYMTAQLVVRGRSPGEAHAIAAAGTMAMKSSADQLGNYLAGNTVTWNSAMKKVVTDTMFSGIAGLVGGKLTGPALSKVTGRLSQALIPQVGKTIPHQALGIFLNKIMSTKAAQQMVNVGAKETIGLFKPIIEKGKAPSKQDFEVAFLKTVTAGMLKVAPVKSLASFASKMPTKVQETLQNKLVPAITESALNKLRKKLGDAAIDKLPAAFKTQIAKDIAGAVQSKAVERYALSAAHGSSGDANESQLHKLGEAGLRKDKELHKLIEDMIEAEATRQAKKAK